MRIYMAELNPHYVTGFVDGEGSFHANIRKQPESLMVYFTIKLRADDKPLLEKIQRFFGCGRIYENRASKEMLEKHHRTGANPALEYRIYTKGDLEDVVIPFFEEYPLQAKKRRDFEVWKQIVELRKFLRNGKRDPILWQQILDKVQELKDVREYRPSTLISSGNEGMKGVELVYENIHG